VTARILVVAGTGSGVGKTSISIGLARALCRRGVRVRAAKVGPDYLDPMQLAAATGRPCLNLDTYMMGHAYVRGLVAKAAADADLILIEGVMGLFDGVRPDSSEGSTAEVARLLGAPILLVADAGGQARSFAATIHGFTHLEPELRIAGVIANRSGSEGHGVLLAEALASLSLPPMVAAIPGGALPHLSSRHLGLLAPESHSAVDVLADAVSAAIPLEAIMHLARPLEPSNATLSPCDRTLCPSGLRLAVADDAAFNFVYADFREGIVAAGVEWIPFSPLNDRRVPEDANALYLPGGYPEEHAAELAANRPLLASLAEFAARRPVYAECGGMMVLGESIVDREGRRHKMAGVLPLSVRMGTRVSRLGYAEVTLTRDSLWGKSGARCRGHEFHYSSLEAEPSPDLKRCYSVEYRKGESRPEGFQCSRVLGSYVHLHLASRPERLADFVKALNSN
jgi:cobyrinic acid a,c-diamide synthase